MIPVVVSCNPDDGRWKDDFAESLRLTWPQEYPLPRISYFFGWELEALKWAATLEIDRFLYLQDSILIKNSGFWAKIDEFSDSNALLSPRPNCYMGIYDKQVLREVFRSPERHDWEIRGDTAIEQKEYSLYYEHHFIERYIELGGSSERIVFPDLTDANAQKIEFHHDKDRLILENDYMIKFKGTWTGRFGYVRGYPKGVVKFEELQS